MARFVSYLQKLRFNRQLENSLIAKYLDNPRLVFLVVLSIVILGISSFLNLPKVLNPSIKIPIVIVSTVLPGAGPNDVEQLVTIPIEDSIKGLSGIDTVSSTSQDSVSVVTVQFTTGLNPDKAQSDVQTAVNRASLPKDAKTPQAQKLDFENTPVWSFSLSSRKDIASLMRFAQILQDKLKDVQEIDRVTVSGLEEQEIQIIIKPEAISTYRVNPLMLSGAITSAASSYPAGSVKTDASSLSLTLNQAIVDINDIRNLQVQINGTNVRLSDIAAISQRPKPDQSPSYLATKTIPANRTVRFDIYKRSNAEIAKTAEESKKVVDDTINPYHDTFFVKSLFNSADEINKQFNELVRDFTITVFLVFAVLFVFLGLKQALVSSIAIPLTFLITFTVMRIANITLSFIAFFSLLLSLGLLVDDTVVVISAISSYFRTKKFTPLQTGLLVWRDFLTPIFTTTITTVWAFLPLLLSTGIIGEFIKPIPIVVSSTLQASFFVAMFITLPVIVFVLKGYIPKRVVVLLKILGVLVVFAIAFSVLPKSPVFIIELWAFILLFFVTYQIRYELVKRVRKDVIAKTPVRSKILQTKLRDGFISFITIGDYYEKVLDKILRSSTNRKKAIAMVILFSLSSYLLLPLGFVRNEFFPKSDANLIFVNVELPPGTSLTTANKRALELLQSLRKTENVSYVTADVGLGLNAGRGGYSSQGQNNILYTLVLLTPEEGRKISSIDIAENLRQKYKNYQPGILSVQEESGGPPAGADVQIKLFGDDLSVLDPYTNKIEEFLKKQPTLTNVSKSVKPGISKLVFSPNPKKLSDNNISYDAVGFWLRMYASGIQVKNMKFLSTGSQSEDITIRTNQNSQYVETIHSIVIPAASGTIPLLDLGTLSLQTNPTLITREKGKRTISVSASVTKGGSVSSENKKLEAFANSLNLPSGYSWSTGGVNEENQKSVTSILQAMVLSFMLILITMVVQFQSFRKAFIVMLVIPLSIAGVFILFALTHTPLSFPALIGILALFGIVVKNSILIVDKINQNIKVGIEFTNAIIDGAESRLEPIALTSFTAIVGLIPITLSNALWQGLGGAIIAGLTFSGTIMLFFIPTVYFYMFRKKEK